MAVLQSTYGRRMPIGANGTAATTHGWDADTKQCQSASIGFGLAVSRGTTDFGVTLGGANFQGISVRDITLVHTTADRYELKDNMAVATAGDWWITVSGAVVAGKGASYNTTTGAIGPTGGTAIAGAIWMTSASSGGLAILRLNNTLDITT